MQKQDILHELTPANKQILGRNKGCFEAILSGNGKEKYLVPEHGTLHYLFRGQNREYTPCLPTIYRNNPSEEEVFLNRMRLVAFHRLLESHPVVKYFFKRHNFVVDIEGLAQHYGLNTATLDLTSNLEIALFFATCKYDSVTDKYSCFNDDLIHEGILYIFDPLLDNEPTPSLDFKGYMRGNIRPIGLQAFKRPGYQEGYALHLAKGQSTKSWIYRFSFTSKDSEYYYNKFKRGELIWADDELVPKAKEIMCMTEFSYSVFKETYDRFRPYGFSKSKLIKAISARFPEIKISVKFSDLQFSNEEKESIIYKWNVEDGKAMCDKILRKPWYEHDGLDKSSQQILGMKNHLPFQTFDHLSDFMLIKMMSGPNNPKGAVWVNYTNTPRKQIKNSTESRVIPASCSNVFGERWLTEKDWLIDNKF